MITGASSFCSSSAFRHGFGFIFWFLDCSKIRLSFTHLKSRYKIRLILLPDMKRVNLIMIRMKRCRHPVSKRVLNLADRNVRRSLRMKYFSLFKLTLKYDSESYRFEQSNVSSHSVVHLTQRSELCDFYSCFILLSAG